MTEKFESPEENRPDKRGAGLSRREFLKRASGAAALAVAPLAFAETLFGETSRAWSKEVKEGDSWLGGIEALRNDVFYAETESLALYVVNQNGTGSWKSYVSGETPIKINLSGDTLTKEVKKGPKKIRIMHSHPLITFQEFGLTKEQIKNLQGGRGLNPSMPPSVDDVFGAILSQNTGAILNKDVKITSGVVDPRGLWEFSVDLNHNFAQTIILFNEWNNALKQYPLLEQRIENNIPLPSPLPEKISTLMPKVTQEWGAYEKKWGGKIADLHEVNNAYVEKSLEQRVVDDTQLKQKFEKLGVTVSFTSFEDLRKEK